MSVSEFVPDRLHVSRTEVGAGQMGGVEQRDVLAVVDVPELVLLALGVGGGEPDAE